MACGRIINGDPDLFPHATYHGHTIFFCTEFCYNAFSLNPDRFLQVHNKQVTCPDIQDHWHGPNT